MPMTIDKAYEILTLPISEDTKAALFDLHAAQKVGAEALMEVKRLRSSKAFRVRKILPGETVI